jgi:predicted transposase/invertase (TIGR01784 family)
MLAGRLSLDAGDDVALREKYASEMLHTTIEANYDKEKKLFILEFSRRIFRLKDPKISPKLKEAYEMQTVPLREYSLQVKRELDKEEGREEGKIEVARSMLADGLPVEIVRKYTGFGEKDIFAIR